MQRTVYSTKFTYLNSTLSDDGQVNSELATITIHESDEKKALKKAVKEIGMFAPLKTETISELYVLDDDIFFRYARVKSEEDKD